MKDVYAGPNSKPTQQLPRAAPASRASANDRPTMARCPLCVGCGMVTPEIAARVETLLRETQEKQ